MAGAKRHIRIADQGHISLPVDMMREHHLRAGDGVSVEDTDRGILISREITEEPTTIEDEASPFAKPNAAEIARRQALFAQMMASRKARDIKPSTTAQLLHLARTEEGRTDDPGT